MTKKQRGFTLIELIVVIAIIAVLAGLILVRISNASRDARNARRQSDMNQIRTAIEQFRINGGAITASVAVQDIDAKADLEATAGDLFPTADSAGKYPSDYLNNSNYPFDPQDNPSGTRAYYRISSDASKVITITRDDVAPIPGDAPTATEVPNVTN